MEILQEELREYYQSLLDLGFRLNKEDILDINVDKNDVRVSYKVLENEDGYNFVKEKEEKLNKVTPLDFINACNYQMMIDDENRNKYVKATHVIADVIKYDEEKVRLNNLLVDAFKKVNNSGKYELVTTEEEVKEDSELLKKGKEFLKNNVAYIGGVAIVGGAIVYAITNSSNPKVVENNVAVEETVDNNEVVNTEEIEESKQLVTEEISNEEQNATEVNDINDDLVVQDEEVIAFDINNDEAILSTVDKIYSDVQAMDDENFKAEMDKDTIEAIVRYVRHSNSEYTGMNIISNEYAYEILTEFFNRKYNIANFYENLDNYEKLNDLVTKAFNIKSDKDSYEDELEVYSSIDYAMNTLDAENFPEVIAIRTVVDNVVDIESMKLVASIGEENGLEGEEYNNEKTKAFNVDAKDVFNKVDINNENAPLTQATYKAIDEDETLGLSR